MSDSHQGTASADSNKKCPSLDGDFGKDFLSTWKPSNIGNNTINFDVETMPQNNKKSFNFDKLDDFELNGDFDKLSSFKMDMSELDFSSPIKMTEKPKDKSSKELFIRKQDSKQEKFSFNFDFNELDRFDLGSSPLKEEKRLNKDNDGNASGCSFKYGGNQISRRNSVTSNDVFDDQEISRSLNTKCTATSRPDNLIEPCPAKDDKPFISPDSKNHDNSCEAHTSTMKQLTGAAANKDETHNSGRDRELSNGACSTNPHVEKTIQEFPIQTVSGDCCEQLDVPKDVVKDDTAHKEDNSMRSVDSLQSTNTSPVTSYNSRCFPETNKTVSPNTSGEIRKHHRQSLKNVTGGKAVLSESTQSQSDVSSGLHNDLSQKIGHRMKDSDKHTSGQKLVPFPLQRDSRIVNSMPVKEKVVASLQFKSLCNEVGNVSQATSTLNQFNSRNYQNTTVSNMSPGNENRESKKNHDQTKNQKVGSSVISESERNDVRADMSRLPVKTLDLPRQITANRTTKSIIPNSVSTASVKSSKICSVEVNATSPKDDKTCDISRLSTSRLTKLNNKMTFSTTLKEAKSVRFSETSMELSLNTASKKANSVVTEKFALLSAPLKRKTSEETTADPGILNPLKRVMESATQRKLFQASQRSERDVVPGTENPKPCSNDSGAENLTANSDPVMGSITFVEVPIFIEKDGNIEKAEACAKELDDICNMLKKKHEEAKELLVRALVNNNTLLMLNHPVFEEKICALERFATRLQSMEF